MRRLVFPASIAAALAAFAAEAGTNPAGRPTGHDRAITRMSPQGLANGQGVLRANPATRTRNPNAATPAVPATPHPGTGQPATPATPAKPADKPPKPPRDPGE